MEEKQFGKVSSTNLDSDLIRGHKHCDADNWIHGSVSSTRLTWVKREEVPCTEHCLVHLHIYFLVLHQAVTAMVTRDVCGEFTECFFSPPVASLCCKATNRILFHLHSVEWRQKSLRSLQNKTQTACLCPKLQLLL